VQGCDTVATCNGTWTTQAPTDSKCSLSVIAQGCPLTFEAVSQGASCSSNGLECNYAKGRCACGSNGGPVQLIDAAIQGHWSCQDPTTQGCPLPRAQLGSACSPNSLYCDYGSCTVPGGTAEICQNNLWERAIAACPVFAGAAQ
jgi:hypothetical protein